MSEHGMPGGHSVPGPSPSPGLLHDEHLQQLHQSIQQQQQQLHQQLTSGSSSISDLIGMLPQTATLTTSASKSSSSASGSPLSHGALPSISHHASMSGLLGLSAKLCCKLCYSSYFPNTL